MATDIGPKIGIQGEAEFRRELNNINTGIKTLGSEMKLVTSEFINNENSVEALTKKNDVLDRTVSSLNERLEKQKEWLAASAKEFGEADVRTQGWQQAVNKTQTEINEYNARIEENTQKIEQLSKETGEASDAVEEFGDKSLDAGDIVKANLISEVIIGGVKKLAGVLVDAAKAVAKMVTESGAWADDINTLAKTTGISTKELQKFKIASERIDVSVDTLAGSFAKLTRNMSSARDGGGAAKEAFEQLGVAVTDSSGELRDRNAVFQEVISALGEIANETERDAAAMDIFGKSAADLNPLILGGADALAELGAEAEAAGLILSEGQLNKLNAIEDSINRFKSTAEGAGHLFAAEVAEPVSAAIDLASDAMEKLVEWFASLDDGIPSFREITEETRDLEKALDKGQKAFGRTKTEIEATQKTADRYIDRLMALEQTEEKTAEQQDEYHRTLVLLTETVPELAGLIDLETDSIAGGTEALRLNTDAWAENAKAQAAQEYLSGVYKEYSEALIEAERNQIRLSNAQSDANDAAQRLAEINPRINEILRDGIHLHEEEYTALVEEQSAMYLLADEAKRTAEVYQKAVDKSAEATGRAEEELRTAEEAVKSFTNAQEKAADTAAPAAKAIEDVSGQLADLKQRYDDAKKAARESIEQQLGLFEQIDTSVNKSAGDAEGAINGFIGALESQSSYMDDYASNIQSAMEKGVDQGLIAKLSDGSTESAQILAEIVSTGEDKIAELNKAFEKTEEGKERFAEIMGDAITNFSKQAEELEKRIEEMAGNMDVSDEAYTSAVNTMSGLISGLDSRMDEVYRKGQLAGEKFNEGYRNTMQIQSPSRVTYQDGIYTMDGLIDAIQDKEEDLAKTLEEVARMVEDTFKSITYSLDLKSSISGLEYQLWEKQFDASNVELKEKIKELDAAKKALAAAESELDQEKLKDVVEALEAELETLQNQSDLEKYTKQQEMLSEQIENQEDVVDAAREAFEQITSQYGESSDESLKYQEILLKEKNAYEDLLEQMRNVIEARNELNGLVSTTSTSERNFRKAMASVAEGMQAQIAAPAMTLEGLASANANLLSGAVNGFQAAVAGLGAGGAALTVNVVAEDGTLLGRSFVNNLFDAARSYGTPIATA